jgi:hypothetical protein
MTFRDHTVAIPCGTCVARVRERWLSRAAVHLFDCGAFITARSGRAGLSG